MTVSMPSFKSTLDRVREHSTRLKELADIAATMNKQASYVSMIGTGVRTIQLVSDIYNDWHNQERPEAQKEWTALSEFLGCFIERIINSNIAIKTKMIPATLLFPTLKPGPADSPQAKETTIAGIKLRWIRPKVYYYNHTEISREFIMKTLTKKFWDERQSRFNTLDHTQDDFVVINEAQRNVPEEIISMLSDIIPRLRQHITKGQCRTVLLSGPPGYGKSLACNYIVDKLGLATVVTCGSEICGSRMIRFLVHTFQPPALIIDDVENADDLRELLNFLESIRTRTQLILLSCNNPKALTPAMIRPGRIDEVYTVDTMPYSIIEKTLEGFEAEAPKCADWPIAFVHEYAVRLQNLQPDEDRDAIFAGLEARQRVNK